MSDLCGHCTPPMRELCLYDVTLQPIPTSCVPYAYLCITYEVQTHVVRNILRVAHHESHAIASIVSGREHSLRLICALFTKTPLTPLKIFFKMLKILARIFTHITQPPPNLALNTKLFRPSCILGRNRLVFRAIPNPEHILCTGTSIGNKSKNGNLYYRFPFLCYRFCNIYNT